MDFVRQVPPGLKPECSVCLIKEHTMTEMVYCGWCRRQYHRRCHNPKVYLNDIQNWRCSLCVNPDAVNLSPEKLKLLFCAKLLMLFKLELTRMYHLFKYVTKIPSLKQISKPADSSEDVLNSFSQTVISLVSSIEQHCLEKNRIKELEEARQLKLSVKTFQDALKRMLAETQKSLNKRSIGAN